jgi:copper chaperone
VSFLAHETLKIEGMECDHCVLRVGRAIASVQGVIEVDVNLETKEAVVEFEEAKTNLKKIKAVVREAGFEAEEGQSGEQVP